MLDIEHKGSSEDCASCRGIRNYQIHKDDVFFVNKSRSAAIPLEEDTNRLPVVKRFLLFHEIFPFATVLVPYICL